MLHLKTSQVIEKCQRKRGKMNIEIKEIICTCNICGTQYEDIQSTVNGFLTEKFHMCPKCIKGVNLKKILEDVEKQ